MICPGDLFRLPNDFKPYGTQMLFYLLFAGHHEVWASQEKLAKILGFSRRTVIRTVALLENLGILSVKRFQGTSEVNRYRLNRDVLSSFLSQEPAAGGSQTKPLLQDSSSTDFEDSSPPSDTLETPTGACSDLTEYPFGSILVAQDGSSSEDPSLPPTTVQLPAEVCSDSADFPLAPAQVFHDGSPELAGDVDSTGSDSMTDLAENRDPSESLFDDPRLELLITQIEEGRKDGTTLFRWLKSQSMLLYWPPTNSYRVDRDMLRNSVRTLDELNAILTGPVRPEYQWFVTMFLQVCRDNGYEVEDTSERLGAEINMFLDSMLVPTHHGKPDWTSSSLRTQLRMMIEEWKRVPNWKQLRLTVEPPHEPTLEFFVTTRAVWEAARERWIEKQEAGVLNFLDSLESSAMYPQSTHAGASR